MSRNPLPEKADVVVVGGGIIGASTLYHLAKAGVGCKYFSTNSNPS
ncbi:MAG: FAD-dependent oxidoreductase [Chloroflexota bacterium]